MQKMAEGAMRYRRIGHPFVSMTIVVLVVQALLLARALPFDALRSDQTFWYIDHPFHQYQIEFGRALLAQGLLTGFDPFFAAGYLGGMTYNVSARLPVLLGFLLPSVSTRDLYVGYVVACAVTAPALIVGMAAALRWTPVRAAVAAAFGLVVWWCGAFRWFDSAGLVSFVLCSYLALAYGAWIVRICIEDVSWRSPAVFAAALVGAAGCWLHPLFGVLVALIFLPLVAVRHREIAWQPFLVKCASIAALVLVANAPWIVVMGNSAAFWTDQPYQRSVGIEWMIGPLLGRWAQMGTPFNLISVVICVGGVVFVARRGGREAAALLSGAFLMLLLAAWGGLHPMLASLQPNRFVAPAGLCVVMAAASFYVELATMIGRRRPGAFGRAPLALFVAASIMISGFAGREVLREVSAEPHGHYGKIPPQMSPMPPLVDEIVSWIRDNTSDDARVLIESSLGRVYGGGHVLGLISQLTHREMIGGPYPFMQKRQSFWDRVGFGEPLADLDAAQFDTGIELYNVGWIVTHSPELQRFVERMPGVKLVARFDFVRIYSLDRPHSFTSQGSVGRIARRFNRVEFFGATGDDLVLRYNWIPGIKVTAPARVEPIDVAPGFPPQIRVISPPRDFVLSTCARCVEP